MPHFVHIGGQHTDREGNVYNPGDMIESEHDLVKAYPGNFRYADEHEVMHKKNKKKEDKPEKEKNKRQRLEDAEDVSDKFESSINDELLVVVKKDKEYFVCIDDGENIPLHDQGMKKAGVAPFIKAYIEKLNNA